MNNSAYILHLQKYFIYCKYSSPALKKGIFFALTSLFYTYIFAQMEYLKSECDGFQTIKILFAHKYSEAQDIHLTQRKRTQSNKNMLIHNLFVKSEDKFNLLQAIWRKKLVSINVLFRNEALQVIPFFKKTVQRD